MIHLVAQRGGELLTSALASAPFALSAAATSRLPVSFRVLSGPAVVSDNTVTITGAGRVVIRASQSGNSNYNAAPPDDRSFTVQ